MLERCFPLVDRVSGIGMLQSRQGFGHLLRRTITEFQGSITYLQSPVPSATFHQLPSSSYLPAATFHQLPSSSYFSAPTYNLRFIIHLHLPLKQLPSIFHFYFATIRVCWTSVPSPTYNLRFHQLPSISYLPAATFQQLPSISYLPAATSQHLPTIYGSSSTYIYHSSNYPPSSTSTSLLSESAGPRDLRDLHAKSAGLPCITGGWTTAELRATYPLSGY
ncbi:hypothetical protein SFRURICE_017814 [Spodoptera frugiperda]|nr:hypothetical protein SFRURICE_017814 [Spodoptera frugiperda]